MTSKIGRKSAQALRDRLVAEHLEYALVQARRLASRSPDLREEFEEAALIALVRATSGEFRGEASFRTYLFRIIKNEIQSVVRTNRQRRNRIMTVDMSTIWEMPARTPRSSSAEENEVWKLIRKMFAPQDRMTIYLHYVRDFKVREIAKLLGASPKSVTNRIYRALVQARTRADITITEL